MLTTVSIKKMSERKSGTFGMKFLFDICDCCVLFTWGISGCSYNLLLCKGIKNKEVRTDGYYNLIPEILTWIFKVQIGKIWISLLFGLFCSQSRFKECSAGRLCFMSRKYIILRTCSKSQRWGLWRYFIFSWELKWDNADIIFLKEVNKLKLF